MLVSLQRRLVLLGLLIVPFISFGELFALFSGDLLSQETNLTGLFKFSKDIIFILIILLGILDYLGEDGVQIKPLLYLLFVLVLVLPPIMIAVGGDFLFLASGIRWLIPAVLPFFIFKAVTQEFLDKVSVYLFYLLLIHVGMQVLQAVFASSWYGTSSLGINLRNPGLFLIPNTGAFFTISCLYFGLFVSRFSDRRKIFVIFISAFSVFLTLSGTGLVVMMVLLFFYFASIRMLRWFVFLIPLGLVFTYLFVDFLSARDANYVQESGGTRLSIFVESFSEAQLVSSDFGLGTNTAVLLGKGEIMDSTFASLIVNLGYVGFFLVVGMLILLLLFSILSRDKAFFVFLLVFILFSMTTIVYEVYPVNLTMGILLVYFMDPRGIKTKLGLIE